MKEGLRRLYAGEFNSMQQRHLPDGSVEVILSTTGERVSYRFLVMDLYGENEQVLEHNVDELDAKPWVDKRMKQAIKEGKKRLGGK